MTAGHPFVVCGHGVGGYHVVETSDEAAFLERARPVLAAQPVTTTILATVAATRASAPRAELDTVHWWVVRDGDGTAVGAAGFAGAKQLLMSAMPAAAAGALAAAVDRPDRRRVHGPADTVAAYAAALAVRTDVTAVPVRIEIVRLLGDLVVPRVPGHLRGETDDDVPLLVEWMTASALEMGTGAPGGGRDEAAAAVRRRRARSGFRIWTVDGRPRAVASWARRDDLARIGPVYTPPAERRRGYGSAVTAALAAELRDDGATVLLHADESNPTSNHIYADLGFAAVARLLLADLVARPADGRSADPHDIPDGPDQATTDRPRSR